MSPWPDAKPTASIAERRAALTVLRDRGYHLVAIVQWPVKSWAGGVRPDQPLRRLPLDLREAADRCRRLAAAYGDLIDFWEIENEPDISFVEENPETYAAFLKACYVAFKSMPPSAKRQEVSAKTELLSPAPSRSPAAMPSQVLMAAVALPPGPYFDAWVANDGLRYTDGFNYHYYGYAEDFTGVYRQFQAAVTSAPSPTPADMAVFQTQFYPSNAGWQAHVLSRFAASDGDAKINCELLQSRPLASEEPALTTQGRWLVSAGTRVRETAEGLEFTIAASAPGPLRPVMAELPLPAGWSAGANASLAFEYRVVTPDSGPQTPNDALAIARSAGGKLSEAKRPSAPIKYPPYVFKRPAPTTSTRKLPVFLTEYGYGLLGPESRLTTEGRSNQRRWFETVQPQIASLGIEGAMAFVLTPYLEAKQNEFGLLMSADSGPHEEASGKSGAQKPTEAGARWGNFTVSPALETLLYAGVPRVKPTTWDVASTSPTPLVLDFVADAALTMAKSRQGYLLNAGDAMGRLILYNFDSVPVAGELALEGPPWTLADDTRSRLLQLAPGERRELPVKIHLTDSTHFGPQIAKARFVVRELTKEERHIAGAVLPPSFNPVAQEPGPPPATPPQVSGLTPQVSPFEVYLRTSNGNLYQTWPRLQAQNVWQWYVEPFASFTPAFFGRAHLPAPLAANEPVALVFFFRPSAYPTAYFIRHASAVEFLAPHVAPVSGKK